MLCDNLSCMTFKFFFLLHGKIVFPKLCLNIVCARNVILMSFIFFFQVYEA